MKKSLLKIVLAALLAAGLNSMAFAAIDLDLDDSSSSSSGGGLKKNMFTIKGGYDFNGSIEQSLESFSVDGVDYTSDAEAVYGSYGILDDMDAKNGFSLSAEFASLINDNFGLGAGVTYQLSRAIDEDFADSGQSVDPKFNFIPIYALAKFIAPAQSLNLFASIHLGYNFFSVNGDMKDVFAYYYAPEPTTKGGLYWGLGGGMILDNGLQFELLYSVNRGKITGSGYDSYYMETYDATLQIVYSKLTLSVGYNF